MTAHVSIPFRALESRHALVRYDLYAYVLLAPAGFLFVLNPTLLDIYLTVLSSAAMQASYPSPESSPFKLASYRYNSLFNWVE
jgi:hypothetical protein